MMIAPSETLRLRLLVRGIVPLLCLLVIVPLVLSVKYDTASDPKLLAWAGLLAAFSAGWWILSGRASLTVSENGVQKTSPFGERALRWDEIAEYRYVPQQNQAAVHFGLVGALVARLLDHQDPAVLKLIPREGRALSLTPSWKNVMPVIRNITERLDAVKRKELEPQLMRGEPVTFERILVQRDGLACGKKPPVPWSELKSVTVRMGILKVRRNGQRFGSHFSIAVKKLPHLFLLLALLRERGVQVESP
jgi:hypothetical protein